jgi:hypothetical protein
MKHKLAVLKGEVDNFILVAKEVNTSLSIIDRRTRQKNNIMRLKGKNW